MDIDLWRCLGQILVRLLGWGLFGNGYANKFFGDYVGDGITGYITGYTKGELKVGDQFTQIGAGSLDGKNYNDTATTTKEFHPVGMYDFITNPLDATGIGKGLWSQSSDVYNNNEVPNYIDWYNGQSHVVKVEDKPILANTKYTVVAKFVIHGNQLLSLDKDDNVIYERINSSNSIFANLLNSAITGQEMSMTRGTVTRKETVTPDYQLYSEFLQYYWNTWLTNGSGLNSNLTDDKTTNKKLKNLYTKLTSGNSWDDYDKKNTGITSVIKGKNENLSEYKAWSKGIGKTKFVSSDDPSKSASVDLSLEENEDFDTENLKKTHNDSTNKWKIGKFIFDYDGKIDYDNSNVIIRSKINSNKEITLKFSDVGLNNIVSGEGFYIYVKDSDVGSVDFNEDIQVKFKFKLKYEINTIKLAQCAIIYVLQSNNGSPDLVAGIFPRIGYSNKEISKNTNYYTVETEKIRLKVQSWLYTGYDESDGTFYSSSKIKNTSFIAFYSDHEITDEEKENEDKKFKYLIYDDKSKECKLSSEKYSYKKYNSYNSNGSGYWPSFAIKMFDTSEITMELPQDGYYYIKEIFAANKNEEQIYCYTGNIKKVKISKGDSKTCKLLNYYNVGNLKVIKVDDDNKEWEDIDFYLKYTEQRTIKGAEGTCCNDAHKDPNQYYFIKKDKNTTDSYPYIDEGDVFYSTSEKTIKTNESGKISLTNLYAGYYEIYEKTKIEGYETYISTDNKKTWTKLTDANRKIQIRARKTKTVWIKNVKTYVSIQGCVWEENTNNDTYGDNGDRNFEGITVQLIDKNNSDAVKMTTTTASNGTYKFNNVLYKEIGNYAVRFVYDGFTYNPVKVTSNDKGSKGTENATDRTNLNNKFAKVQGTGTVNNDDSITTVQAINSDGNKTLNLDYKTNSDGIATYDNKYKYTTSGSTIKLTKDSNFTEYDVKAETAKGFSCKGRGNVEIKNINLGLKKRQQADLNIDYKLTKIYQKVGEENGEISQDVTISGRNHDYGSVDLRYAEILALYDPEIQDSGLQMKLEYEIMITNETDLHMKIYELSGIANSNLADFKIIGENPLNLQIKEENGKLLISTISDEDSKVIKLSSKGTFTITIQATVKTDSIKGMYNKDNKTFNDMSISNVIEINKYSTYDTNDSLYAALDKDSAVGNISGAVNSSKELDSSLNFAKEDDISANKVAFKSGFDKEYDRIISGNVFEDLPLTNKLKDDNERIGNGMWDDTEKNVQDVLVELISLSGNNYKTINNGYSNSLGSNDNSNIAYIIVTEKNRDSYDDIKLGSVFDKAVAAKYTDEEGYYEFSGILPGKYLIRFVWGDKIIYKDLAGNEIEALSNKQSQIVKSENQKENITVQNYKSTIRPESNMNEYDNELWYNNEKLNKYSDALDDYDIREKINLECSNISYSTVDEYKNKEYNLRADTNELNISIGHKGKIEGVDFGLIERPKQDIQVTKEISDVKLALANGDSITQGPTRDENGKIRELSYATYLKPSKPIKGGLLKMELDSELVHGATLEVIYKIIVENLSEIDYNDPNYYKYGKNGDDNNLVKATIKQVIDYMENDGLVYKNITDNKWTNLTNSDLEREKENNTIQLSDDAYEEAKKYNQKLLLEDSDNLQNIKPNEQGEVSMFASRYIANSEKDLTYNNDVEVIRISNLVGRFMSSSTPGNHIPQAYDDEKDNDNIDVSIVPPTGQTRIYYVLGITSLLIIALGVVIIKKKVIG